MVCMLTHEVETILNRSCQRSEVASSGVDCVERVGALGVRVLLPSSDLVAFQGEVRKLRVDVCLDMLYQFVCDGGVGLVAELPGC